uniref:ATP synthase complex subunit 8 n=1 Tax=Ectophasia rotundiventris TaxID=569038 RepID=A0A7L7S7A2_9MUSC|nr:ATP synthase F0 subunit 8 [Ectophasia rotundiventris]QNV49153.1 ATP synthase F0 subunit 8 [Ectophasia rotundiventris]
MPQMAPIGWLSLFIMFTMAFLFFNMMNYYSFMHFMPKSNLIKKSKLINSLSWKW